MDFFALAQTCAPDVHPTTMAAVAHVESSFNPYAIGVVGGALVRQPQNKEEAVATAQSLEKAGYNFSVGVGQVNRHNLRKYGLTYETAFEPCSNLRAGASILRACYERAKTRFSDDQTALQAAFSCYYSGNFSTGFRPDFAGQPSYVQKILNSAGRLTGSNSATAIRVIAMPQATARKAQELTVATGSSQANKFSVSDQGAYAESVMVYR